MEVAVMNTSGTQVKTMDLPADIFNVEINTGLMHQAYVRQMANGRQGTVKTKRRSEIRMSGRKIWRQKGTGRARHGAASAPIFVGGGLAHGPRPRKYTKKMPKRMRRQAIRSALSALLRDEQLVFVDNVNPDSPRTKDMKAILDKLTDGKKTLVLYASGEDNIPRSVGNLRRANALHAAYLNIRDLLSHERVIISESALDVITSIWGQKETNDA